MNTKKIISEIDNAKLKGDDIIIFPEMAVPGYLLGDEWENYSYITDCFAYNNEIRSATNGIFAIWGNVDLDYTKKMKMVECANIMPLLSNTSPSNYYCSKRAFGFDLRKSQNGFYFTSEYLKMKKDILEKRRIFTSKKLQMLKEGLIHTKSRTEKHASYPVRFTVPDEKVLWDIPFALYNPTEFNAPIVLDSNTPWADPNEMTAVTRVLSSFEGNVKFDEKGLPINPIGRTGLKGRGVLGRWGANFAVDGIVTTFNPISHQLQVLTITRTDTGETALPGGMVDSNETPIQTRNRELKEELSIDPTDLSNFLYESYVYRGYVDDPRNTDNAWIETTVIHTHLEYDIAQNMRICAGDDASDFKWIPITTESLQSFYANHGLTLLMAVKEMVFSDTCPLDDSIIIDLKQQFTR